MPVFTVYNAKGEKSGEVNQPELFSAQVKPALIHRYVTWVRTVIRPTLANTKTRGEVSGGGKKPWRQKGTGRARVGSSRSPLWRKGGIIFGPRATQNWATRLPRTERRLALFGALASKAKDNQVVVIEDGALRDAKTADAAKILRALPIPAGQKVLHVIPQYEDAEARSVRNVPGVTTRTLSYMNVLDLLNHDVLLISTTTVEAMNSHFSQP